MKSTVEVRAKGGRVMRARINETQKGVLLLSNFSELRDAIYVIAETMRAELRFRCIKVEKCRRKCVRGFSWANSTRRELFMDSD